MHRLRTGDAVDRGARVPGRHAPFGIRFTCIMPVGMSSTQSSLRWLAPLALILAAALTLAIVLSSGGQGGDDRDGASVGASVPTKHWYRIKRGDTLSGIAIKTGVGVETIETLNPKLDARELAMGERIRLRPKNGTLP